MTSREIGLSRSTKGSNGPSNGASQGWVHRPYDETEVRDMAIPWKWLALAALAAITAILLVIMTTGGTAGGVTTLEPIVSYEELTRIIGPVAI
jgi:hypothetical protein